jgi:predicted RND superfamily exporter protein
MLQSMGVGAAVAIGSAMVMNLLIVPALLSTPLGDWIIVGKQREQQRRPQQEQQQQEISSTEEVSSTTEEDNNSSEAPPPPPPSPGNNNCDDPESNIMLQQPLLEENGDCIIRMEDNDDDDNELATTTTTITTSADNNTVVVVTPRKSVWIRLSRHLLHPYKSIIILLLLIQFFLWPLGRNVFRLQSSTISFESLLPATAPSLLAYQELLQLSGGPGKLAPFRILLDGTAHDVRMDSASAFESMHRLVQELLRTTTTTEEEEEEEQQEEYTDNDDDDDNDNDNDNDALTPQLYYDGTDLERHLEWQGLTNTSSFGRTATSKQNAPLIKATFTGISVIENIPIPYSIYIASQVCGMKCPIEAMRALNVVDERVTSEDRFATYLTVELSVSPFADEGIEWLEQSRRRIQQLTNNNNNNNLQVIEVYIEGSAAIAHDAVQAVYQTFPWVIGITLGVVFLLLGLFFGSIVPPLRSVVSISCTLSVSFGLAVLVYQDGILSQTHMRSLMAFEPELCWLVPIMSFSIIVGLALDYDVFLVTRILEFRLQHGYRHESSIAAALDATGGIITAAGIIMAISFGSLLGSSSPALNQWSFLLTTAVLVDTFVVRTIVVPTLTGWTGKYSWFPRTNLPVGHVRLEGFDSSSDGNDNNNDNDE